MTSCPTLVFNAQLPIGRSTKLSVQARSELRKLLLFEINLSYQVGLVIDFALRCADKIMTRVIFFLSLFQRFCPSIATRCQTRPDFSANRWIAWGTNAGSWQTAHLLRLHWKPVLVLSTAYCNVAMVILTTPCGKKIKILKSFHYARRLKEVLQVKNKNSSLSEYFCELVLLLHYSVFMQ